MAAAIQLNVQGLENLKRKMDQLSNPKKAKAIARKAARQAMNIVRDEARARARMIDDPETAEKIFKNISVASGRSKNSNEVVIRVGVRGGASFSNKNPPQTSGGDTRHFRWLEFGSANNRATPFMRPALSTKLNLVTAKFVQVFDSEISIALGGV